MGKTKTLITLGLGERFHGNLENLVSRIRRQVERHSTDCEAVPFIIISCIRCKDGHAQTTPLRDVELVQAVGNKALSICLS